MATGVLPFRGKDVGQEICQRRGLKAMILGTISAMGSSYLIQLKAIAAQSGTILAMEQVEAASKEKVIAQLAHNNLGISYESLGQLEAALEEFTEAVRLSKRSASMLNLARCFRSLNRFQEAEEICNQAFSMGFDTPTFHNEKYILAAIRGDAAGMEQQDKWLAANGDESVFDWGKAQLALVSGQIKKFRELGNQAARLAEQSGSIPAAASYLAGMASAEASLGFRESRSLSRKPSSSTILSRIGPRRKVGG